MNWSLRDLYRTLEEPGGNPMRAAQAKLDTAVRAAYAMPKDADILALLLHHNHPPHFPALRADALALSGASRRK